MEQNERRKKYIEAYKKEYNEKNKQLNLTLTNKEYERFKKLAQKENKKISTLIKELSINQLNKTVMIPKEIADETRNLTLAILNIANNINQMAHYSNISGLVDVKVLFDYLKQLDDKVKTFFDDLLRKIEK